VVTLDTADEAVVAAVAPEAAAADASSDILQTPDVVWSSHDGPDVGDTHSNASRQYGFDFAFVLDGANPDSYGVAYAWRPDGRRRSRSDCGRGRLCPESRHSQGQGPEGFFDDF
jgi:hypothetical protein